jgi:hypothetical protein
MDDMERLRPLLQKLGGAINDALGDSMAIADALDEIKKAGFDVFLVLEASIGFNRREDAEPPRGTQEPKPRVRKDGDVVPGTFTAKDKDRLLREFKIRLDD